MMGNMKAQKHLSDLRSHLGYSLRIVSNAVSHSFARRVEAQGVTVAEWVVLRVLFDHDTLAPSLLAQHLGMTRGAISKLADRLVEKGLVTRGSNPDDGRGQTLELHSNGRKLVPRLAALADDNDAAFFQTLSQTERQQLKRLLSQLIAQHELTGVPTA